jgi:hypothetical protein
MSAYPTNLSNIEMFSRKLADSDSIFIGLETLFMRSMEDVFNASFPIELRYEMETPEKERWLAEQRQVFRAILGAGVPVCRCSSCNSPIPDNTRQRYGLSKPVQFCRRCEIELEEQD